MSAIRPFRFADVPAVADLWLTAFHRAVSPEAARRMFIDVFFEHPFRDDGIESLVLEEGGAIGGFIGALPRRALFAGQPIRVAVASQLMVTPGPGRAFAAFELVRALFGGPQDLTFGDGSTDRASSVWERLGGAVAHLYSLDWLRVLRPASQICRRFGQRRQAAIVARALAPACRAVDGLLGQLPYGGLRPPEPCFAEEPVRAETVLEVMTRMDWPLTPDYAGGRLGWLLAKAAAMRGHGELRARLCRDRRGEPMGWYTYYARPGGVSQVLQLGGRRGMEGVIANLLADAYARGSVAVSGQAAPFFLRELSDQYARFRCLSLGVLVHSRRPEIVHAVQSGDAFLTRLDGAWWLPFGAAPRVL